MREIQFKINDLIGEGNYSYVLDKVTASRMTSKFDNGFAVVIKNNEEQAIQALEENFNVKFCSKQSGWWFVIVDTDGEEKS